VSASTPSPGGPTARIVTGKARVTRTEGTRGRTLFPSPDFSHWPPFEMLAEAWALGTEVPDPHPHVREEVVVYALSGSLWVYDDARQCTVVPPGSAAGLTAVQRRVHDVNPKPGERAHWFALVLHLSPDIPELRLPFQVAAAVSVDRSRSGLRELRVVGDQGPIRSTLGLEMRHLTFEEATEARVPVDERRAVVVYVISGRARVADRSLTSGGGFLGEGMRDLSISGGRATRLIWASVPRPG